jgi:hypothetical protein
MGAVEVMKRDLLDVVGKNAKSAEALDAIEQFSLTEVDDDPPFRSYVGSRANGLDLLIENERVIAAQIFVQAIQGFSAFPYQLPLGLQKGMSQKDVHQLLGEPLESDEFDSKFGFPAIGVRLVVNFDKSSTITYLNIGILRK